MASSTVSYILLCFFLFLVTSRARPSNTNTKIRHDKFLHTTPKQDAERLIKAFNLSPKHDINIQAGSGGSLAADNVPRLVEKQLDFFSDIAAAPGPSIKDFGHYAGYFSLPHTKAARMFYLFFESRNKKKDDPVVIWLTGGPGCSSELALFYENGPFQITDNMSLVWNDFGWDKASNLIYVDQPTGTGFSYSTDDGDLRHNETGVSNDLYNFMQEFFKAHPQYTKNEFYITGESYAGHYIPAFAGRVHQGNLKNEGIHINLKGFAIGNGLTDPAIQYKAYTDYSLMNKLIDKSDYDRINELIPDCEAAIKACGTDGEQSCINAYSICNQIFNEIMDVVGNINYYDIRKQCQGTLCYDFSNMETFLNMDKVRSALGVGDIDFVSCSSVVYNAMLTDWMRDLEVGIPTLLEAGIKVLIYTGEEDLICNWLGNSRWVNEMKWSGKTDFINASTVAYRVGGAKAGELKSYGPLAFLKVYEAGHMVPMDQPRAALQMLQSWTKGMLGKRGIKHGISLK